MISILCPCHHSLDVLPLDKFRINLEVFAFEQIVKIKFSLLLPLQAMSVINSKLMQFGVTVSEIRPKTTTRGQFEKVKNETQTENCHLMT